MICVNARYRFNNKVTIMNFGIIPASWSGPILSLLRIITGLMFLPTARRS